MNHFDPDREWPHLTSAQAAAVHAAFQAHRDAGHHHGAVDGAEAYAYASRQGINWGFYPRTTLHAARRALRRNGQVASPAKDAGKKSETGCGWSPRPPR